MKLKTQKSIGSPVWVRTRKNYFLFNKFFPAKVLSYLSQLGQTQRKFSSLSSLLTPLIWSNVKVNSLPFQKGSCPQIEHLYSV